MKSKRGRKKSIYPDLPERFESPHNFWLSKISQIDNYFQREIEVRKGLAKKYGRAYNVLDGALYGCGVVGAGLETTGIALAATGIGVIPGAVLGGLGLLCFVLEVPFLALQRSCLKKQRKHEAVAATARVKRDTVHDHVSKALQDSVISEDEFRLITAEAEKYTLKAEIRKPLVENTPPPENYDEIKKMLSSPKFQTIIKGVSNLKV